MGRGMKEIERDIQTYQDLLNQVPRPCRSEDDLVAERFIGRLLRDAKAKQARMDRGGVKLYL